MAEFTPTEQASADRIPQYNNNAYNPSTNQYGFDNSGHVQNFQPALQDSVNMAVAALRFADEALAAAGVAAVDFTATSSTSVTIGTGTKNFTIETGKAFVANQRLNIADTGNPQTNYMLGDVVSYDSGTGALSVSVDNAQGSGTISNWAMSISTGIGGLIDDANPTLANNLTAGQFSLVNSTLAVNDVGSTGSNQSLNLALYNVMLIEPTSDISITFNNIPSAGKFSAWAMKIKGGGDHTFTWPAAVNWAGGSEPAWSAGTESDWVLFLSTDGGTSISAGLMLGALVA